MQGLLNVLAIDDVTETAQERLLRQLDLHRRKISKLEGGLASASEWLPNLENVWSTFSQIRATTLVAQVRWLPANTADMLEFKQTSASILLRTLRWNFNNTLKKSRKFTNNILKDDANVSKKILLGTQLDDFVGLEKYWTMCLYPLNSASVPPRTGTDKIASHHYGTFLSLLDRELSHKKTCGNHAFLLNWTKLALCEIFRSTNL